MHEYWRQIQDKESLERGIFLILPLVFNNCCGLDHISVPGTPIPFQSDDFIELMNKKCRVNGNFVRRYRLNMFIHHSFAEIDFPVSDIQFFAFYNGVAFITVYLDYSNKNAQNVYQFINPGYLSENMDIQQHQLLFLQDIQTHILNQINPKMTWFQPDENNLRMILKEAYRMNVAYVPHRFPNTDIIRKVTYNVHRLIELSRDFEDSSETDLAYVSGAKDVDTEDYGWGCAISSQDISFVYVQSSIPLYERSANDLLLTLLVMHQKYSCLLLDEEIYQRHSLQGRERKSFSKNIQDVKWEAMKFIAYGTLEPSQISRWNNICDIYRLLIAMTGVEESLTTVKAKINLINEQQDQIDSRRETIITMIIAVFGLVSIIASVLQIVDFLSTRRIALLVSFGITMAAVLIVFLPFIRIFWKRKKSKGDV